MPIDIEYDEAMGNAAAPECLLNISRDEPFFEAVRDVMPFCVPADGDATRAAVPIVFIEKLFRRATVENPAALTAIGFLAHCLHLTDFLLPALDTLLDNDLLPTDDDDQIIPFTDPTQLQGAADALVLQLKDDPSLVVKDDSWDDFDATGRAMGTFQWLDVLTIKDLVEPTGDISLYVELSLMVGPRAVDVARDAADGQLYNVGAATGDLIEQMRIYFKTNATAMYLRKRLPSFLDETRWPSPFDLEFTTLEPYAFDLPARAQWSRATRSEWPALVLSKIDKATERLDAVRQLLHSVVGKPALILKELQAVGDAMLPGETSQKLPLLKLDDLEKRLQSDGLDSLIKGRRAAGDSTSQIGIRLVRMLSPLKDDDKQEEKSAEGVLSGLVPPKRAAVRKATADAGYVRLEAKWLTKLQGVEMSSDDTLDLLDDCFNYGSVLPIAVLVATPGVSLNAHYTESDFLNLLKDKRDNLALYVGQGLAVDSDDDEVPEGLRTFAWDQRQLTLFCQLDWGKLDPVNHILLALCTEETTNKYEKHLLAGLYRDPTKIQDVRKHLSKLFAQFGYPSSVPASQGVSYDGFMKLIHKLSKSTLSMDDEASEITHMQVERFMSEGFQHAARRFARKVYGAQLAGSSLGAWIEADDPTLTKLQEAVKATKDISELVRKAPGRLGGGKLVGALPGYSTVQPGSSASHSGQPGPSTPHAGKPNPKPTGKQPSVGKAPASADEAPTGDGPDASAKGLKGMTHATRLKLNPKKVFYYDGDTFSMGKSLYDWPGIAGHSGSTLSSADPSNAP